MRRHELFAVRRGTFLLAAWLSTSSCQCRGVVSSPSSSAAAPALDRAPPVSFDPLVTSNPAAPAEQNTIPNAATLAEASKGAAATAAAIASSLSSANTLTNTNGTAAAAASAESIEEATERLRAALRVLSVIERAKSDQQKLKISAHVEAVTPPAEAEPDDVAASPVPTDTKDAPRVPPSAAAAAAVDETSNAPSSPKAASSTEKAAAGPAGKPSTTTTSIIPSSHSSDPSNNNSTSNSNSREGGASPSSVSGAGGASSQSWASATSSWIRNKRPKFWALVNDGSLDGADEAPTMTTAAALSPAQSEASTASTGAPTAAAPPAAKKTVATAPEGENAAASSSSAGQAAAPARKDVQTSTLSSPSPTSTSENTKSFSGEAGAVSAASAQRTLSPTPLRTAVESTGRPAPVSAHSIRTTTSIPPFRSRYKKDVAHALSELLCSDPAAGPQLLAQLSAESRRLLLIMGTASEYFGVDYGEVAEQIKEADTDRDNSISSKEFDAWVGHMAGLASTRRRDDAAGEKPPSAAVGAVAASTTAASTSAAPAHAPLPASKAETQTMNMMTTMAITKTDTVSSGRPSVNTGKSAAPLPPTPAATEKTTFVTTHVDGTAEHPVAPSATLSRQRAEMAISTARAASARIIEVMQKNVPHTSAPAAGAAKRGRNQDETSKATTSSSSPSSVAVKAQPQPASTAPAAKTKRATTAAEASVVQPSPSSTTPSAVAAAPSQDSIRGAEVPPSPSTTSSTKSSTAPPSVDSTAKATPETTTVSTKAKKGDPSYIPWPTFARVVVAAAPPFLAFGMLDNCTLVLAGGAIDNILSAKLGLTQMAAASLGGVVSGVAGIQVHGLAERFTRAKPPLLTPEQERSDSFLRAENVGNTLGMVVGLILGMTPLLFMGRSTQATEEEEKERERFHEEAKRSHERKVRKVEKTELHERQIIAGQEKNARDAIAKSYRDAHSTA